MSETYSGMLAGRERDIQKWRDRFAEVLKYAERYYVGFRAGRENDSFACSVVAIGGQGPAGLDVYPLTHLAYHSPTGFEWGYAGSGPSDLARSIIGDILRENEPDPVLYHQFKEQAVARLPKKAWAIRRSDICTWALAFLLPEEKKAAAALFQVRIEDLGALRSPKA